MVPPSYTQSVGVANVSHQPILGDIPPQGTEQATRHSALQFQFQSAQGGSKLHGEVAKAAKKKTKSAGRGLKVHPTFQCGICFDDHREENAAVVDGCGHKLCRPCMKTFLSAKIKDRRFPVLCPICTAGDGDRPASKYG